MLQRGDVRALRSWLQDNNIAVDAVITAYGDTLLHEAVRYGRLAFVKTLHEFGADIDVADHLGLTPLDYANYVDVRVHLYTLGAKSSTALIPSVTPLPVYRPPLTCSMVLRAMVAEIYTWLVVAVSGLQKTRSRSG